MSESEELNNEEPEEEESLHQEDVPSESDRGLGDVTALSGLYQDYFLDYASYVILERAVPSIFDGLKPVQRRILHAMKAMDDGRFHKVANVIGQTMMFHPHGDAAIGDALVNLGQKDLLLDTQGNWGDTRTGDSAAAARYIESRLSKFALHVLFNSKLTEWQASYDGRNKEPVTLPSKFPILLAQGVDGIAVGLATRIMPHNFIELCEGAIAILKGETVSLMPDFPNGGYMDGSNYNDGLKGGRIKLRAIIEEKDKRTLLIKTVPYGTTTSSLIDSIIKANDQGKIKIKKVVDNTAADVEVEVQLHPNVSPDMTIDALYAFSECELSISPNSAVVVGNKPEFLSVNEILRRNTLQTRELLKMELELRENELQEKLLFASLEKIFIEKRIYRKIEEAETWEEVLDIIDKGLKPYKKLFYREINRDDIARLTEIRIKRISKYNSFQADELMKGMEKELEEVRHHLANLTKYTVAFFKNIITQFGKGKERKTEIRPFENIDAAQVAVANLKLYVDMKEGFIGYGLRRDGEYIGECSDIDDVITFRADGTYQVTRVAEKTFVGKNIIHAAVWTKGDEHMVYNLIYLDGKTGVTKVKRFSVTSITRDREYNMITAHKMSKVLYFSANPNSESEVVNILLSQASKARLKSFPFDFADIAIKGRNSKRQYSYKICN